MEQKFKEQIIKNRLLDNQSNKSSVVSLRNFAGDTSMPLLVANTTYGLMHISVSGIEGELVICYNNIKVLSLKENTSCVVPMVFVKDKNLTISGVCKLLIVGVTGGDIQKEGNYYYLPYNKFWVDCKFANKYYLYENADEYVNNNYSQSVAIDNILFMGEFTIGSQVCVGALIKESDGVYLSVNKNNNTTSNKVFDNVYDAIVVYTNSLGLWTIIYNADNKIQYKVFNSEFELVYEGVVVNLYNGGCQIVPSISSKGCLFGVVDGNILKVYCVKIGRIFEQILQLNGCGMRIFEGGSDAKVVALDGYDAQVLSFVLDNSRHRGDMVTDANYRVVHNVIDYMLIDDIEIIQSVAGEYSKIN